MIRRIVSLQLSETKRKDLEIMGNFGKKLLGAGAIGAAAGAAVYYFVKKKNEDPDLQEEFADFQDNIKETAASAVNVASRGLFCGAIFISFSIVCISIPFTEKLFPPGKRKKKNCGILPATCGWRRS